MRGGGKEGGGTFFPPSHPPSIPPPPPSLPARLPQPGNRRGGCGSSDEQSQEGTRRGRPWWPLSCIRTFSGRAGTGGMQAQPLLCAPSPWSPSGVDT